MTTTPDRLSNPSARLKFVAWAMNPITGGPTRKARRAPVAVAATPALGATPGARAAAPIITGMALASPMATKA